MVLALVAEMDELEYNASNSTDIPTDYLSFLKEERNNYVIFVGFFFRYLIVRNFKISPSSSSNFQRLPDIGYNEN